MTSFASAEYTGTLKVMGGSGTLKGATGSGRLSCTTDDAVHYDCTEKLTLSQAVKIVKLVKVPVHTGTAHRAH